MPLNTFHAFEPYVKPTLRDCRFQKINKSTWYCDLIVSTHKQAKFLRTRPFSVEKKDLNFFSKTSKHTASWIVADCIYVSKYHLRNSERCKPRLAYRIFLPPYLASHDDQSPDCTTVWAMRQNCSSILHWHIIPGFFFFSSSQILLIVSREYYSFCMWGCCFWFIFPFVHWMDSKGRRRYHKGNFIKARVRAGAGRHSVTSFTRITSYLSFGFICCCASFTTCRMTTCHQSKKPPC